MQAVEYLETSLPLPAEEPFSIYSPIDLQKIDLKEVPRHIAFIPDGNRRWAEKQQRTSSFGHKSGADILIDTVKAAKELGVKVVTFYTFSTENWTRPPGEVDALMWLFHSYLLNNRQTMLKEGIRLGIIGDLSKIPNPAHDTILESIEATKDCSHIDMVLAINYGGRDELLRAFKKVARSLENKMLTAEEIDESTIASCLDTFPWGDPELLIRTSGEMRISNFLIWQLSYTELYVADALWPEFSHLHLLEAVVAYQKRQRRLGN